MVCGRVGWERGRCGGGFQAAGLGTPPIYYPGVLDPTEAMPVGVTMAGEVRGIDFHLQSSLVSVVSEAGEEITDFLLTGIDHLADRGLVNRCGDTTADFFELSTQGLDNGLGGHGG